MTLELATHHSGSLLEGLKTHPQLEQWLDSDYPLSINTDDPGVFDTTATKEWRLLQKAYNLSREKLNDIVIKSMDYAFCDASTKETVVKRIQEKLATLNRA